MNPPLKYFVNWKIALIVIIPITGYYGNKKI